MLRRDEFFVMSSQARRRKSDWSNRPVDPDWRYDRPSEMAVGQLNGLQQTERFHLRVCERLRIAVNPTARNPHSLEPMKHIGHIELCENGDQNRREILLVASAIDRIQKTRIADEIIAPDRLAKAFPE